MVNPATTGSLAAPPAPAARRVPAPKARGGNRVRAALTGWLFVAPALALFLLLGIYTIGYGVRLSFIRWNGFTPTFTWVGLDNYKALLYADPVLAPAFRDAALHTVAVMIASAVLTVGISLPLAIMLNTIPRFRTLLRSVYFLPYITTGIAIYYAWRYVLEPDGAVNQLLGAVGLGSLRQPDGWLGSTTTALPTLTLITVWGLVPVAILLYLTGLQGIDPSVLDAAAVDGARAWVLLRRIYWPLLRPITAAVVLLNLRETLQGFQLFLVTTNGGPGGATNVLGLQAYNLAFNGDLRPTLGLASALGWMLFVAAVALTLLNLRLLRSAE